MLASMTGFVAHTFELSIGTEKVPITLHLKSLNGRFFEASCRMPHALAHLEPLIIKKMRERLYRGTIFCNIYLGSPLALSSAARPSWPTIEAYVKAAHEISEKFAAQVSLKSDLDVNSLLMMPHAIEFTESPLDTTLSDIILQQIAEQIDCLTKERLTEGRELELDLVKRIKAIGDLTTQIKERARVVFEERRTKLMNEMTEFIGQVPAENRESALQALYGHLEKLDITEETVRLDAHHENALHVIAAKGIEKGKKLDFILQEMFRETNTIAAKCADSTLVSFAIAVKVELEKAREQVQNIV
ncbi:MAG: YicC family protein [Candidatus Babeliaceae bacterium]|nr:YicC family protein [Candidatus Babeliaceae bacterium]